MLRITGLMPAAGGHADPVSAELMQWWPRNV